MSNPIQKYLDAKDEVVKYLNMGEDYGGYDFSFFIEGSWSRHAGEINYYAEDGNEYCYEMKNGSYFENDEYIVHFLDSGMGESIYGVFKKSREIRE